MKPKDYTRLIRTASSPQEALNSIEDAYKTAFGHNKSDLIRFIKSIVDCGYDESYDQSMILARFTCFTVCISPCCIEVFNPQS